MTSSRERRRIADRTRAQAGFTLLELMVTLAVAGIVTAIVSQVVYMQNRALLGHLATAEAQQNARATISLLQRYARAAGWGLIHEPLTAGVVVFGACYDDANPESGAQRLDCDNIDVDDDGTAGTDRLRILSMMTTGGGAALRQDVSVPAGAEIPVTFAHPEHPLPVAEEPAALVSGPCAGGGSAIDLVALTGVTASAPGFSYTFTNLETGGSDFSCPAGYDAPFSVGGAQVVDFWIDRATDPAHPALRMRTDPTAPLDTGWVVAHDIDDLQVRFMLDVICEEDPLTAAVECPPPDPGLVGDTLDFVWDASCDDLDPGAADDEGGCNGALDALRPGLSAMPLVERFNRVIGAQIAVVARTRDRDPSRSSADWDLVASDLTVHNHTYRGRNDGYRRWIYRTTVAFRNRGL